MLIEIPHENNNAWVVWDSLYSVALEIKPEPDYGRVIAKFDGIIPDGLRLLLHNVQNSYDNASKDKLVSFNEVQPGSYVLSYYIDENLNKRRDIGCPLPYAKPEILYDLDTKIDVRARWDTELSESYKIVIENK